MVQPVLRILLILLLLMPLSLVVAMPAAADGPEGPEATPAATATPTTTPSRAYSSTPTVSPLVISAAITPTATATATPPLAPGDLDTTFGTGGKVTTDFGGNDQGRSVAIQSDGKIVVAGISSASGTLDFALARYNADGSLDTTFGTGGKVTTDFGGTDYGNSVAIQGDGKIVVADYTSTGDILDFALARYNADGSLDSSFGTGGKVTTDFGGDDAGVGMAIQSDGKIVVAGRSDTDFALARYNADGSLDSSFGTGGKVTTDFGGTVDYVRVVAIQSGGSIVVAGRSNASGTLDFALARYNANGSLDSGFGTGGKVTTDFGGDDSGRSVAIQGDGKMWWQGFPTRAATTTLPWPATVPTAAWTVVLALEAR